MLCSVWIVATDNLDIRSRPDWAFLASYNDWGPRAWFPAESSRHHQHMQPTSKPDPNPEVTDIRTGGMEYLDTDRTYGFLNEAHRDFILNNWDAPGNAERTRRVRARRRFTGGLRDLYYLRFLPKDDRQMIVHGLFDVDIDDDADEDPERIEPTEYDGVSGIKGLSQDGEIFESRNISDADLPSDSGYSLLVTIFKELYTALDDATFTIALENGVEQAIINETLEEDGIHPDIEAKLRIKEREFGSFDADRVLSLIEDTPPDRLGWAINWGHVERLYQAGKLPQQKYEELRDKVPQYREMSEEEQHLREVELEEQKLVAARTWNNYEDGWSVNDVLFLRHHGYLSDDEARAILEPSENADGTEQYDGFRYTAHVIACAYDSEHNDADILPASEEGVFPPADLTIGSSLLTEEGREDLREWHESTYGGSWAYQEEADIREKSSEDASTMDHTDSAFPPTECVQFEIDEVMPPLRGEEMVDVAEIAGMSAHSPQNDPKDFPSVEELTPTHIEKLYEQDVISEDRYHELLLDRFELAPNLLSDDQVRSLFAAGELEIEAVASKLDPEQLTESDVVELHEEARISRKQYLDILEMKHRLSDDSLSPSLIQELRDEGRIDAAEISSVEHQLLFNAEIYTPEQFLDQLEILHEEAPEEFNHNQVLELFFADRITAEEAIDHPSSSLPHPPADQDSVVERYEDSWGREDDERDNAEQEDGG